MSDPSPLIGTIVHKPKVLADILRDQKSCSGRMTIPFMSDYDFGPNNKEEPRLVTIPFYTTKNLTFNLRNSWGEIISSDMLGSFNSMLQLIGLLGGGSIAQGNLQSKTMQTASWQKSEIPSFSIDTIFISTNRRINPLKILKALAAGALPSDGNDLAVKTGEYMNKGIDVITESIPLANDEEKKKNLKNGITTIAKNLGLTAPFGYNPNFKMDTEKGTMSSSPSVNRMCSVSIGKWFLANNLIVDSISNIDISKEVIAPPANDNSSYNEADDGKTSGYPVYVRCNIVFRPYTIITAKEFAHYFIDEPKEDLPYIQVTE